METSVVKTIAHISKMLYQSVLKYLHKNTFCGKYRFTISVMNVARCRPTQA